MKLTAATIAKIALPPNKQEVIVYDDEIAGFGLRIRAGGTRNFIYQYRIGTKNRRLTLGAAVKEAFPAIRERVLDLQAKVRLGEDPAAAKEAARKQSADTFEAIANRYLAVQLKAVKPATYTETERYLLVKAKRLHGEAIAAITRRNIAELLSDVAAQSGDVTANRLRGNLSAMFTWAMKEGLCEHNAAADTFKRQETPRDRVLVDDELRLIWNALDDDAFGRIVRLLVLTGQRRDEIGGLRWSELSDTCITLPKHRTKNGNEHVVPLSEAARDILTRQPRIVGRNTLFSSVERGFSGWHKAKERLDARLPPDMPHWTLHDVRRSVATGMANLGVLPHVIEAVLNHVSGHKAGVASIYNRSTYLPEKHAALVLWAEHLMAVTSGKTAKVVPLKIA